MRTALASHKTVLEKWEAEFDRFTSAMNGSDNSPYSEQRNTAFQQVLTKGIPTTKDEEWKYTSVLELVKKDFHIPVRDMQDLQRCKEILDTLDLREDVNRMIFYNGYFIREHSVFLDEGFTIRPSDTIISEADEKSVFTDLNASFCVEESVIEIANNAQLEYPVQCLVIVDNKDQPQMIHPRINIRAGVSSQAKFVINTTFTGSGESWINSYYYAELSANSNIELYNLQTEGPSNATTCWTEVSQEKDSVFTDHKVTTEGSLVRNDLIATQKDRNCETNMYGLYFLSGAQHVDNHTLVNHAVPNGYSNELYKGVLGGTSTGVFNGKILVQQDAQKTNAFQSNKNILLSKEATVNTKPQLEIFADDVKCSHGATTGQLDEDALFYLKARGIPEKQARSLLTIAFANDIAEKITIDSVRSYVEDLIGSLPVN